MQKVERKKSLSICYICVVNNLCISWQLFFMLSLKYLFLSMFVCMCGCICVLCVCCVVYAPHIGESTTPAVFLYHLPPYFLETGFLPELEVHLFQWGWLSRTLLGCSVSVPYCWVPGRQNHAGFLCGCSGSHSGPHSYTPNQSPVQLSFLSLSF